MPKTVRTSIEIDATAERVWEVLTDFAAYAEWNPSIVASAGEAKAGTRLRNTVLHDGKQVTFKPTVLVANPGRELRWLGRLGMPGIFDGEHYFRIEEIAPDRVRLTQGENFGGVLARIAPKFTDVEDAFVAVNEALKARAEGR